MISDGRTVYYVHKGCPNGGLSEIEKYDEYISAPYFAEGVIIPETSECSACGGTMTLLDPERATSIQEQALARNALRRKELGQ